MRREGDGRGGKEIEGRRKRESIICFFLEQVVVAVCICQNIECLTATCVNTIEGFMKVCVMMFYFHCCSIIVGSLPFICTVKWHVCEPWIN